MTVTRSAAGLPADLECAFRNGGLAGAELAALDWTKTAVGGPAGWSLHLRAAVSLVVSSRFSMWMAWGEDLTFFCNDAYRRDTLGGKFPWALGRSAREVWSEIWPDIGPRIAGVMRTAEATWDEGLLLFLERSGYVEETYHTFSYSPLLTETGEAAGILCVVTEDTQRVIGARRMATLRELGTDLGAAGTEAETLAAATKHLSGNPRSLPFTMLFLAEDRNGPARLACHAGVDAGHRLADPALWPPGPVVIDLSGFADVPTGAWDTPPREALVLPLRDQDRTLGQLVTGLNPYRLLDRDYRGFLELLASQIAAGLSSVRALEAERIRAEALEELDRAKTAFFANISHEFRTPLTLMLGPLGDAAQEGKPLMADELATVHRNGQRLLKLVNALLEFSRVEAGRMNAQFAPIDLAQFTTELAGTFRDATSRGGLKLTIDCEALPEPAFVDRDMWERIVLNLLSNAFKFTLSGGIEVRLLADEGHAELVVADTGSGIPAGELDRLFQRFHRIEGTRGRSYEGTGIGLALVKEFTELHGGTVTASSVEGAGSQFTVRIPLGAGHLPAAQIRPPETAGSVTPLLVEEALSWLPGDDPELVATDRDAPAALGVSDGRILIADDNADLRRYLQRLLAPRWDIDVVADGAAALAQIRRDPPDLLLTDAMMPELDGYALVAALRADPATRDLPVIMLSARAGEEATIDGLRSGADDYLPKPFSGRELIARVRGTLDLAQLRRESRATLATQRDVLAGIANGDPLDRTLDTIVRSVERVAGSGAVASVRLTSSDGRRLLHGAAPSLPAEYNEAIDGISVGPSCGSCGTAVYRGERVVVADIATDPLWADFRDLALRHGLRACWSTPIRADDGQVVGTFALHYPAPRAPADHDLERLELMARTAAVAIVRSRITEARDRHLADLQSSLRPTQLPRIAEVDLAAGFYPGSRDLEVGGDTYDVFAVDGGGWGILIADVCGHGAEAAAATAIVRHTARLVAASGAMPSDVLGAVDEALWRSDYDRFATAVYGRLDLRETGMRLTLACGGHPEPYVLRAATGTVQTIAEHGPLLGAFPVLGPIPDVQIELHPGDVLLLYTDGLPERNHRLEQLGGLEAVLTQCIGLDARSLLHRLEGLALGPEPRRPLDDVALLAVGLPA